MPDTRCVVRLNSLDGMSPNNYTNYTKSRMQEERYRQAIENIVKRADLSIENVVYDNNEDPSHRIKTIHSILDKAGKVVGNRAFDLDFQESLGTRKFFSISAPILDSLQNGKILVIDELDASLHPLLSAELVRLFSNPQKTPFC